ncbi:MAG: signal recognition particle receptor subunit alpha, partial [Candidatus Thermoplasmatota archaeon]|nr:signal recognition particle receptor subunit alpha [Candidatus Thermoplasmatota archaeon]
MGLFDRFKKRFKKSSEDEISADEDSAEAKQASEEGAQMRQDIAKKREAPITPPQIEESDNEWDDDDDIVPDPFAATPTDRKQKKKAQRAASVEEANKPEPPKETQPKADPMQSTTGRKLIPTGPVKLEVDFGDSATKTGGRVITASSKLDSMLEELEEELLTSDMAQGAAEEVISTLKANLIGTRLSGTKKLDVVLEEALRHTLLKLLQSGYWDFDKTVETLLEESRPVVIMIVGVNGTGKTTTTAKIAHRLSSGG